MSLKLREMRYTHSNPAWALFNRCNTPVCEYFGGQIPVVVVYVAPYSEVFEALELVLCHGAHKEPGTWR